MTEPWDKVLLMFPTEKRFVVVGRTMLVISGNAIPGDYRILDVFDVWREAERYRNQMDGREKLMSKHGNVADVCDVRIFEATERL